MPVLTPFYKLIISKTITGKKASMELNTVMAIVALVLIYNCFLWFMLEKSKIGYSFNKIKY